MSQALLRAGPLKADIRLAQALSEFEATLSSDDKARLRSSKSQSQSKSPTVDDVMRFTAEVDAQAKRRLGSGRCFGPRLTNMLQAMQQFAALGDILVGGSQNLIACGVWSVVRMTILAVTLSASGMERLSLLFMSAGRSAPRYQGLALLYARSRHIRDYLAEYMTIVVQVCHYFHDFSHKSTIGQITSSLSDSKIRNAEEELKRWAHLIKDEASFLQAQTTEREAAENSNIRKWLSLSIGSSSLQRKIDKRLQWLNAFSTFDYETPWKQARKRGSSSFFVGIAEYKQWKEKQGPPSLLLSGKMGCGKSVIMANMIDDLSLSCPEDTTIYFFCRHDIPESLKAKTVFGSFAAQISQRHLQTDIMDSVFSDSAPFMSFDKILELLPTMIKRMKAVRLILDGVDECPQEEFDLICTGLRRLRAECSILSCISYRDQADGLQAKVWIEGQAVIVSVPNDNPDIREFVEAELERLREFGDLSIGDPSLLMTIREALLHGANGMFLWVALQLNTICAQKTDNLIRQALEDLPKTLSETFRRILQNSKQEGHCYQTNILKILVGANRPLTVAEFREALSVTPGNISWDPGNMINNIYATLACCGSLVIIDEEEGTVRLLHQSVTQFLHNKTLESGQWSFSAQSAIAHMGDVTITYLNYGVFDKRVSTGVVPQMYAGRVPEKIVSHVIKPFSTVGRKLAKAAMKSRRLSDRDIGVTLSMASNTRQDSKHMSEKFEFLVYALENWLPHTTHMSDTSLMTPLFRRLLDDPSFSDLPWNKDDRLQNTDTVGWGSATVLHIPRRLRWAILHSHCFLFSMELRGSSGVKALLSVVPYLNAILKIEKGLRLSSQLSDKLLRITTAFRASEPTDWLIQMHGYSIRTYLGLLRNREYSTLMWATMRASIYDSYYATQPLLEEAVKHNDVPTVMSLLKKGASLDIYKVEPPLQLAMRSCFYKPENIFMVSCMLRKAGVTNVAQIAFPDIFWFLYIVSVHASHLNENSLGQRLKFDENEESRGVSMAIIERACERGDFCLFRLIKAGLCELNEDKYVELINKALLTRSSERINIVKSIIYVELYSGPFKSPKLQPLMNKARNATKFALARLAQLRDWGSISYFESYYGLSLEQSVDISPGPFYGCVDTRDLDGLRKICKFASNLHSYQSLLAYATASKWESLEEVSDLFEIITYLQVDFQHKHEFGAETRMSFDVWSSWARDFANVNVPTECSERWERTGDLILIFCVRVLHFLSRDDFLLDHNLPGGEFRASRDYDLQRTVGLMLGYINTTLQNLSYSGQTKATWCETVETVLRSFDAILRNPSYMDRTRWNILDIAETLLGNRFIHEWHPASEIHANIRSVYDGEKNKWCRDLYQLMKSLLSRRGILTNVRLHNAEVQVPHSAED
ncbi:hypothetical protein PFICI_02003 [Pestalotiopsis fici W106-1]|uniref:NACHT domain-containing protein n=1 Tax=Pestalotiopsis fici (strain W106-1 / CGMCC3.15140) TaxID=1229662 RepID=W3XQC6_PESFW|nr:uncharacterized protein PFICI_02003 [Pestalotiopsis fici W106-1]ETS88175.1 hypothetical protein PFICI_02003 [Pestalotiopsis fici W106-1]